MNIIYKYTVDIIYKYSISKVDFLLPKNGAIVKIGMQGKMLCFWVSFKKYTEETEHRQFYVVGTGQIIPVLTSYIDTVFDGEYVWHVFEELPK